MKKVFFSAVPFLFLMTSTFALADQKSDEAIISARQALINVRESPNNNFGMFTDEQIQTFLELQKESGKPLVFFGTNPDELKDISVTGNTNAAMFALRKAKFTLYVANGESASDYVATFRSFQDKADRVRGNRPLKYFRTSECQLGQLTFFGLRNQATYWLIQADDSANSDGLKVGESIKNFLEFQKKSGEKLEDFGFSAAKLQELKTKGYVASAKYWLSKARACVQNADTRSEVRSYIDSFRAQKELSGKTLAELGTSESEIEELLAKGH